MRSGVQIKLKDLAGVQKAAGGFRFRVRVVNAGAVDTRMPVRVDFYDGHREAGGVLLTSATTPGPIKAGESVRVTAQYLRITSAKFLLEAVAEEVREK